MSDQPSFREELERLEAIVRSLEDSDLDLDDAIELFQDGVARLKRARELLRETELTVKKVSEMLGKPIRSVYDVIGSGLLPAIRRPSASGQRETVSVRVGDLADYMRSGEPAADKNTPPTATRETPEAILARLQSQ